MKKYILLIITVFICCNSFAQINFRIGKAYKMYLSDSVKTIAYIDEDSCLHVMDSSATINVLIKTSLEQYNEIIKLNKQKEMLINLLSEYTKSAKYAKLEE